MKNESTLKFFSLFKVLYRAQLNKIAAAFKMHGKKEEESFSLAGGRKKKNMKAVYAVLGAIGFAAIGFYLISTVSMLTKSALLAGAGRELLSSMLVSVQFAVLMLGSAVLISSLYYGKDNQLLLSLPIRSSTIFGVKFFIAYLSETFLSVVLAAPILITFGVTASLNGMSIHFSYYIFSIISVFLLPVLPLFLIAVLSMPLMYVGSFLRKRAFAKVLVVAVISAVLVLLYLALILGSTGMTGENGDVNALSKNALGTLTVISKIGVINQFLVSALLGVSPALNFFFHVLIVAGAFALAIFLSSVFYRKGLALVMEDSKVTSKKAKKGEVFKSNILSKSFLVKEIKTILGTPALLLNCIMGVILIPLMLIIMLGMDTFNFGAELGAAAGTLKAEIGGIGYAVLISSAMAVSTNTISLVGFSMEGKNIYMLKSLPITGEGLAKSKLTASSVYTALISVVAFITHIIISPSHNPLISLLIAVSIMLMGLGATGICLSEDLKNPNFNAATIKDLTKNNKKLIKPMLITMSLGFIPFILSIVLMFTTLTGIVCAVILFAVIFASSGSLAFFSIKKLFDNAESYYERIEI